MADEEIVGIIDGLVGRALCEGARIDGFEGTDAAFQRPGGVVIAVLDFVVGEPDDIVVSEIRVSKEDAI